MNSSESRTNNGNALRISFTLCCLITGYWLYIYGCDATVGGFCKRYRERNMTVTNGGEVVHGTVLYDNVVEGCVLKTGVVSFTESIKTYNDRTYPVGSVHNILYDDDDKSCLTVSFASNLAISGFVILILTAVMLLLPNGVYDWMGKLCKRRNTDDINESITDTEINTQSNVLHTNVSHTNVLHTNVSHTNSRNGENFHNVL